MSKLVFIALSLLVYMSIDLHAQQIRIINPNLINPDTNILFMGFENLLYLEGKNVPENLSFKDNQGNYVPIGVDLKFKYSPRLYSKKDTISIYLGEELFYQKIYQVTRFPDPELCICKETSDTVTKKAIVDCPWLLITSKEKILDMNRFFHIINFEVAHCNSDTCIVLSDSLINGGLDTIVLQDPVTLEFCTVIQRNSEPRKDLVFSNPFNSFLLEAFQNSNPGDKFIFDNIRATSSNGSIRKLSPYIIWIKD